MSQTHESVLDSDMAKLWEAYRRGWLGQQELLPLLLARESGAAKTDLLDELRQRYSLAPEAYDCLRQISAGTYRLPDKKLKPRSIDLLLAQHLIEYQMVDRAEAQRLLRVQSDLHKLTIPMSLASLLVSAKLLSTDIIDSTLAELKKRITEKQQRIEPQTIVRQPIISRPPKKYPVVLIALGLAIVCGGILAGLIRRQIRRIEAERSQRERQVAATPAPEPIPPKIAAKPPAPTIDLTEAQHRQQIIRDQKASRSGAMGYLLDSQRTGRTTDRTYAAKARTTPD